MGEGVDLPLLDFADWRKPVGRVHLLLPAVAGADWRDTAIFPILRDGDLIGFTLSRNPAVRGEREMKRDGDS